MNNYLLTIYGIELDKTKLAEITRNFFWIILVWNTRWQD